MSHNTIACEIGCCPHCADERAVKRHEEERDVYWREQFEAIRRKRAKAKSKAKVNT